MRRLIRENRGFILFLICYGFLRTAVADWNPIPSGSMRPTLLEGDVVLVNRVAYDFKLPLSDIAVARLGEPARGDVVTFTSPRDGMRLIKRLVGLPGDVIELRNEHLVINGEPLAYDSLTRVTEPLDGQRTVDALRANEHLGDVRHAVQVLPSVVAMRNFGPFTVPPDSYFFLGDNRDNSADSRYFGAVPRHLLIGRAHHIVVSADILGHWIPRVERFARPIDPTGL